jgi:Reverse transcriptase (RNA-dependent DNA polymerase)
MYKIKYHSYKTQFVAKGYTQTYGINYHETFAPIAKMNIVWILLSITVNNYWTLNQMNVRNIFL